MKTRTHLNESSGLIRTCLGLLLLLLGISVSSAATGTPPEGISYQGYLTGSDGTPLASSAPENFSIKFRIWTEEEGGTLAYSEEQTVTVDNGSFGVLLGEGAQISGDSVTYTNLVEAFTAPDASDRYVELTVGTGSAIAPRLRLVTSPYAFLATKASSLGDGSLEAVAFDGSTLTVAATNMSIGGTTSISGKTTLTDASVGGALEVTGTSHFDSEVTVDATISATALNVTDAATFASDATITGKATVGELESTGAATFNTTLGVSGKATLSDDLVVHGTQNSGLASAGIVEIHEGTTKVLRLDGDEIQSVTPGVEGSDDAVRTLHLNIDGGDIKMGQEGSTTFLRNPLVLDTTEQLFSDDVSDGSVANVTHNMSRQLVFESLSSGKWAIGTERENDASDEDLYFAYWDGTEWRGKGRLDVDGDFVSLSDRRFKQDIENIESGTLDRLMALAPVRYRLKGTGDERPRKYGFIAQDVAEIFPDLADLNDSTIGLPYARFGVLAIAGVRELRQEKDTEIKSLRSQLQDVKGENERLNEQLNNVLKRLQTLESLVK